MSKTLDEILREEHPRAKRERLDKERQKRKILRIHGGKAYKKPGDTSRDVGKNQLGLGKDFLLKIGSIKPTGH